MVSSDGIEERTVKLVAGAIGHTAEEVDLLRAEAGEEMPWDDKGRFDRHGFLRLHPHLKARDTMTKRTIIFAPDGPCATNPADEDSSLSGASTARIYTPRVSKMGPRSPWRDLKAAQRSSAEALGFDASSWDKGLVNGTSETEVKVGVSVDSKVGSWHRPTTPESST